MSYCKHKYQQVRFRTDIWGKPYSILLRCTLCCRVKELSSRLSAQVLHLWKVKRGVV